MPATATAPRSWASGQVAVGDDDVVEALAGDGRPAGVDGAVESRGPGSTAPRRRRRRPTTPRRRRRRRRTSAAAGRRATTRSASQRASSARCGAVEQPGEAALGRAEPLHRDEDGEPPRPPTLRAVPLVRDDRCDPARPRRSLLAVTTSGITGVLGQALAGRRHAVGGGRAVGRLGAAGWHVAADDRWHTPADGARRPPATPARRAGLRDPAARAGWRRRRTGCGRSPTAVGAPSSRSPTTRRCPWPAPSPGRTC